MDGLVLFHSHWAQKRRTHVRYMDSLVLFHSHSLQDRWTHVKYMDGLVLFHSHLAQVRWTPLRYMMTSCTRPVQKYIKRGSPLFTILITEKENPTEIYDDITVLFLPYWLKDSCKGQTTTWHHVPGSTPTHSGMDLSQEVRGTHKS